MQIIVVAGAAGVGKTLLANLIAEQSFKLGMLPKLVSFAGKLKEMANAKGYDKATHPSKYREYCQSLGKTKRDKDPEYWIKKFESELDQIQEEEDQDIKEEKTFWERCIIVDDCRYLNELAVGRKRNATLIFMSFGERSSPNKGKAWMKHDSEAMAMSLEKEIRTIGNVFDCIIENDGTIGDLEALVETMSPAWCGVQVSDNSKMDRISQCVEELIDLLFFEEDEDDKPKDPD
jgi:hypothetical protein